MPSPESANFQKSQESTIEKEESPELKEVLSERFLDVLAKNPSTEKIVQELKNRFNEMETATKSAFDKSLDLTRAPERVKIVESFTEKTALEYISLHKKLVGMLDLMPELEGAEREQIIEESQKTVAFYEGHTLLSFYVNRHSEKKKSVDSLIKNTENAALQQSLAKYYLRHRDDLDEIEPRLDTYGKKAFGSKEDYEGFKRGVVNLANAYQHLESMGHEVFFPPPRMDAQQAIDLFYIEKSACEEFGDVAKMFSRKNFSAEDFAGLDPSLLSHIYGVQVKTRHNLQETYEDLYRDPHKPKSLNQILEEMSLDKSCFDCLDEDVVRNTKVLSNSMKGVTNHESLATMFICPPIKGRSYSFHGDPSENMDATDRRTKKARDDIQELITFLGRNSNIGSVYVFVESMQNEPEA